MTLMQIHFIEKGRCMKQEQPGGPVWESADWKTSSGAPRTTP